MSSDSRRSTFLFSAISAMGLVLGFVVAAFAISSTQDDPGRTGFQGGVKLRGVILAAPYPHLMTPPSAKYPQGRAIPLASANGKRGVGGQAKRLNGQIVELRGFIVRRGDGEMMQVTRRIRRAKDQTPFAMTKPTRLGRWRLSGEICDGQCVLGIMKPGRGLAHKACANFCIAGGIPPMFVTEKPVEGSQFMLLGGPDGGPMPASMYDKVGPFITVEGRLERRGNLLFFFIDPAKAEVR
ncbi:MAG: hypothetical protein MRY74_15180 [Neomegalonema sp.]|nr:hypothetical protein [Neomegalonema sp.]